MLVQHFSFVYYEAIDKGTFFVFQEIEVILKEKWGKKDAKARERDERCQVVARRYTHTSL